MYYFLLPQFSSEILIFKLFSNNFTTLILLILLYMGNVDHSIKH